MVHRSRKQRAVGGGLCVHQIQVSPSLPFTNATAVGVGRLAGAEPQLSAAPGRRPIDRCLKPHALFYRASASELGS